MGIFSSIKDAIFGHKAQAATPPASAALTRRAPLFGSVALAATLRRPSSRRWPYSSQRSSSTGLTET